MSPTTSNIDTPKKPNRPIWKKALLYIGGVGLFFLIIGFAFFFSVLFGYFGELPDENELKAIKSPIASEIYASDGSLIGRYFIENRSYTHFEDISKDIINALVATEDARFYKHKGIDKKSYLRVLVKNIIGGNKSAGGGSTITQQIIKNLYARQSHSFLSMPVNKIKEAIIATRLESVFFGIGF